MRKRFQKPRFVERPKRRSWLARGAALFGVTGILLAVVGSGIDNGAIFELDGNASVESTHDWNQIYQDTLNNANTTGALARAFTSDVVGAGDDILTGGNTKDPQPFSKWLWKQTSTTSVQDKDDIAHAFAAAYKLSNGHTAIFFGSDRFSNSGDSQMGFWFVQDPNVAINNNPQGGASGGFNGQHTDGDLLIVSHFVNGGSVPQITLFQWRGPAETGTIQQVGGVDANLCNPANGSVPDICAITNTGSFGQQWSFTEKASDNPPLTGLFIEGGIDLQNALGSSFCFNVFFAETRSSASPTSTLSDFVKPVPFSLCTVAVDKSCSTGAVKTRNDGSNFVRYQFSGKVYSPDGIVFNPEVTDTFPTGATNTHIGQGGTCTPDTSGNNSTCVCTPANGACTIQISAPGGLSGGAAGGVTYSGYFDVSAPLPVSSAQSSSGSNPNKVRAKAAASSDPTAPKTVTSSLVSWDPNDTTPGTGCNVQVASTLTLAKGCAVNIVPNSPTNATALNLQVQTEIRICSTVPTSQGGVQVTGINLVDNVIGLIASNVTLNAPPDSTTPSCIRYYPKYTPTVCSNTADGRCVFTDTVSIRAGTTSTSGDCYTNPQQTGCPVNDFGGHVTPIPQPAQATCRVCPPSGCSTTTDTPFPDPLPNPVPTFP